LPGVEYVSFIYLGSTTCGSGAQLIQVMQFTANSSGKAVFNALVPPQASDAFTGASISVQRVSDNALLSCGEIISQ
jgi:hypothetical protein